MNSTSLLDRTGTSWGPGRWWTPKSACAVVLALVFLCGAASGALVMDYGIHGRMRQSVIDNPAARMLYMEHMQRELQLTPAQSEQIQSVLDDFWQYYHVVLSSSKDRVEQLLSNDQKIKFEKMLQQPQR